MADPVPRGSGITVQRGRRKNLTRFRMKKNNRHTGISHSRIPAILLLLIIPAALVTCKDSKQAFEQKLKDRYPRSAELNTYAAFIAGMDVPETSSLCSLTRSSRYLRYRADISRVWERYERRNLRNIKAWRAQHLESAIPQTVLYPFSGPDILNALAFYPDAGEFIMIGLESPGTVPDISNMPPHRVMNNLLGMKKALRTLLLLNFFRTAEMQEDLRDNSFADITGVMMFFLARCGYEILDINHICIDSSAQVKTGSGETGSVQGVKFIFRKGNEQRLVKACFFSADLSDTGLAKHPEFLLFIKRKKAPATLLKSGSYLLGYDNFSTLRNHILQSGISVLQDDAGIPYRFFNPDEWDLRLYGRYRVLEMFSDRFQDDLALAMKGKNVQPIPFSYGYGFQPHKSNLMYALRKQTVK